MSNYPGIDYSLGKSNFNPETGIHFGVIPQNDCSPEAVDDICTQGEDVAFKTARDECTDVLKHAIQTWYDEVYPVEEDAHEGTLRDNLRRHLAGAAENHTHSFTAERIAKDIAEDWGKGDEVEDAQGYIESAMDNHFGDGYESDGGLGDYLYEKDGYKISGDSHGDIWVFKSPYYSYAQFCSPCAPGAGYLTNECEPDSGAPKTYCLDSSWFEDNKAPYRYWRVDDNTEVLPDEQTSESPG